MKLKLMTAGLTSILLAACGGGGKEKESSDITPDSFVFESMSDLDLGEILTTTSHVIVGIDRPVSIDVQGCAYALDGGTFMMESGEIANGESVQFQIEASSNYDSSVSCHITVGEYSTSFTATTKQVAASANFVFIPHPFTTQSPDNKPAPISSLYVHRIDGSELETVTTIQENVALFVDTIPEAYTAVFESSVDEQKLLSAYTSFFLDEEGYNLVSEAANYSYEYEGDCKTLTFDRSAISDEYSDAQYLRVESNHFCDREWSVRTEDEELIERIKEETEAENNVLVTLEGQQKNIIGYRWITSDTYSDSDRISIASLESTFKIVPVVNDSDENPDVAVIGFQDRPNDIDFLIGQYAPNVFELNGSMNVIEYSAPEYLVIEQYFEVFGDIDGYRQHYRTTATQSIPDEIILAGQSASFEHVEMQFGSDINVNWAGAGLERFPQIQITINGKYDDGRDFLWVIKAPNTGSVTVPMIPDVGNPVFESFESRIYLQLYAKQGTVEENTDVSLFLDCDLASCYKNIYID